MATRKAQHLLWQSAPLVNSVRGLLPYYRIPLPSNQQSHRAAHRQFTTTPPSSAIADLKGFLDATESRRSIYQLTNESTIPDARIQELVAHTIKHIPSSFNSQTTRLVVAVKQQHEALWDAIMEVYKVQLPAAKFEAARAKMLGFRSAYGTVLFYEDTTTVREFQEKYHAYEDRFPQWSEQTNGMHQYALWCALEAEGLGVNLQHYNPLIDTRLETMYGVPDTWSLKSQMVFGKPTGKPREKTFKPVEERVKYFGV